MDCSIKTPIKQENTETHTEPAACHYHLLQLSSTENTLGGEESFYVERILEKQHAPAAAQLLMVGLRLRAAGFVWGSEKQTENVPLNVFAGVF